MPLETRRNRLHHMLDAAEEVLVFTAGKTYADFQSDRQLQHACLHCFLIIGEAANALDIDFRAAHPDIPWRAIIAMRHRLIHGYFDVELALVWDTVSLNIPNLLPPLRVLVAVEDSQ